MNLYDLYTDALEKRAGRAASTGLAALGSPLGPVGAVAGAGTGASRGREQKSSALAGLGQVGGAVTGLAAAQKGAAMGALKGAAAGPLGALGGAAIGSALGAGLGAYVGHGKTPKHAIKTYKKARQAAETKFKAEADKNPGKAVANHKAALDKAEINYFKMQHADRMRLKNRGKTRGTFRTYDKYLGQAKKDVS